MKMMMICWTSRILREALYGSIMNIYKKKVIIGIPALNNYLEINGFDKVKDFDEHCDNLKYMNTYKSCLKRIVELENIDTTTKKENEYGLDQSSRDNQLEGIFKTFLIMLISKIQEKQKEEIVDETLLKKLFEYKIKKPYPHGIDEIVEFDETLYIDVETYSF